MRYNPIRLTLHQGSTLLLSPEIPILHEPLHGHRLKRSAMRNCHRDRRCCRHRIATENVVGFFSCPPRMPVRFARFIYMKTSRTITGQKPARSLVNGLLKGRRIHALAVIEVLAFRRRLKVHGRLLRVPTKPL